MYIFISPVLRQEVQVDETAVCTLEEVSGQDEKGHSRLEKMPGQLIPPHQVQRGRSSLLLFSFLH